jgi:hypothetical protein
MGLTLPIVHNRHFFDGYIQSSSIKSFNVESEIKTADAYTALITALQNAREGDVINIHLAGYGGDGGTMMVLISAIKASNATTVAIVEAPVYSAHAYLALSCNKLVMRPHTTLMLHNASTNDLDCDAFKGLKDRGHDESVKCRQLQQAVNYMGDGLLKEFKLLTDEERQMISDGYDLYLTADEINFRQVFHQVHEQHPILDPIVPTVTMADLMKLLNAK